MTTLEGPETKRRLLIRGTERLVLDSGGGSDGDQALGLGAIFDTVEGLEAGRSHFQVVVLAFEVSLLLLQAVDLVTIRIGFGNLCQV